MNWSFVGGACSTIYGLRNVSEMDAVTLPSNTNVASRHTSEITTRWSGNHILKWDVREEAPDDYSPVLHPST